MPPVYAGGFFCEVKMKRKLVLENQTVLHGVGFGSPKERICEIVFNTSMVGYQEILSDPSYHEQFVVMTYPLIGNYGITNEDFESLNPSLGGFIVREFNQIPSNFRASKTLEDVMNEYDIVGISEVDTRKITRIIRNEGSMKALITDEDTPMDECLSKLNAYHYPHNQVKEVTCKRPWRSRAEHAKYNVTIVDCGMKLNIVRSFNEKGCNVHVVPYGTDSQTIMKDQPDGVFFSNGPGNPEDVTAAIQNVKDLQGKVPIFGICLGHQVIALANGLHTYKMKFGHRGGNHPVKNLNSGKVEITSQNHSYAVVNDVTLHPKLTITHINLLDNTIEGLRHENDAVLSVQYHPESAPGPQDSHYLFDEFIDQMKKHRGDDNA